MLKKSTPLFVSIFVLLFIGLSDYGYGCHGGKPPHEGCGDEEGGKSKSIALIMKFDDVDNRRDEGIVDNVKSDNGEPYVNEEGAGVGASERSAPNPAAGLGLGLNGLKKRIERRLYLDIKCEEIDFKDEGIENINKCVELPAVFPQRFPTCGVENNFCSLGASVRPYKVSCPGVKVGDPCPDVFTMDPMLPPELMSFRLPFGGGGLLIEVASAIGGGGSLDPGRCLSLLTKDQLKAFLDRDDGTCGDVNNCNVSVEAFDLGNVGPFPGTGNGAGDRENDAWRVVANGVTALICLRNNKTHTVLGKTTLWFGFKAIKKEGAFNPF